MPAYFNISVQFRRAEFYPTFVKDFYTMLDEAGMKFLSGYWGFEKDSLEETIEWNQRKLEENFNLGFTEHHSHGYKLLELSKEIWQFPSVRAIQTGLESCDVSAGLAELAQGGCPNTWPFAIVEETGAHYKDSIYDIQPITEGKRGLIFWRTGTDNI